MYCLCEAEGGGFTEIHCAKNQVFSSEELTCVPDDKAKCLRKYPISGGSRGRHGQNFFIFMPFWKKSVK